MVLDLQSYLYTVGNIPPEQSGGKSTLSLLTGTTEWDA